MVEDTSISESKCPKCGGELKEGYIYCYRGPVTWMPKNEKMPLTALNIPDSSIKLGKYSFLKDGKATAMNCERCKMVIIEYGENND